MCYSHQGDNVVALSVMVKWAAIHECFINNKVLARFDMHDGDYAVLVSVALSSCVDWKCRIVVCNYGWPSDDIFATIREQNIRECSNTIVVDWSGSLILWNAQCLFNMYEIWGRPWHLLSLIGILHFSENLSKYNPDWNTRKTSGQEKIQTSLFRHASWGFLPGRQGTTLKPLLVAVDLKLWMRKTMKRISWRIEQHTVK